MTRRGSIATLFGALLARFTPKPTTTLSAAPLGIGDTIEINGTYSINPERPFVIVTEEMTVEEFQRRYPSAPIGINKTGHIEFDWYPDDLAYECTIETGPSYTTGRIADYEEWLGQLDVTRAKVQLGQRMRLPA